MISKMISSMPARIPEFERPVRIKRSVVVRPISRSQIVRLVKPRRQLFDERSIDLLEENMRRGRDVAGVERMARVRQKRLTVEKKRVREIEARSLRREKEIAAFERSRLSGLEAVVGRAGKAVEKSLIIPLFRPKGQVRRWYGLTGVN